MTLRVCSINENGAVRPSSAPRYTQDDTDQTLGLPERHEPVKESDVRDREGVAIVASSLESTHRRVSVPAVPDRCR